MTMTVTEKIDVAKFASLPVAEQAAALEQMTNDLPYGIRTDRLEAFADQTVWRFADNLHAPDTRLALADIQDSLQKELNAPGVTFRRQTELQWEASRAVLSRALKGFDWDAAIRSGISPDVLGFVAADLWSFLVVNGGAEGQRRSQMLQCAAILSRSATTGARPVSGAPSSAAGTGSEP